MKINRTFIRNVVSMDNIRAEQKCNVQRTFSWGDPLAAARSETPKSRRAVRPCRVL